MKTIKTSLGLDEKLSISDNSNGIENYEVAIVQPGKGIRYRFPYNGGLFSEAAKRRKYRQTENFNNEGMAFTSEI